MRIRALRAAALVLVAIVLAVVGRAQENPPVRGEVPHGRAQGHPDLFIEVPLDRYSSEVVFPFGGSHHRVPGVVAVNRAPYFCEPHRHAFRDRADFVAHLRLRHGIPDAEIPQAVLAERGQVRYIGD